MVDRFARRDAVRRTASMTPPPCNGSGDPRPTHGNRELLQRLRELDFSLYDTILYLDAYPDSTEALAYYNKLIAERAPLIKALSASHNAPITAFDNTGDRWDWVAAPWPWEASAN